MNALQTSIRASLANVVASLKNAKDGSAIGRKAAQSAVSHVREYAKLTHEAGIAPSDAAEVLATAWKSTKLPAGTIKPYSAALRGYRQAISEGENIENTGDGKPMTAPVARTFNVAKEKRAAEKALAEVRAEIAKRVKAIESLADLIAFRDVLPEVEGEVKTVAAGPSVDDMLANLFADEGEDEASQEGEAVAAAA